MIRIVTFVTKLMPIRVIQSKRVTLYEPNSWRLRISLVISVGEEWNDPYFDLFKQ